MVGVACAVRVLGTRATARGQRRSAGALVDLRVGEIQTRRWVGGDAASTTRQTAAQEELAASGGRPPRRCRLPSHPRNSGRDRRGTGVRPAAQSEDATRRGMPVKAVGVP